MSFVVIRPPIALVRFIFYFYVVFVLCCTIKCFLSIYLWPSPVLIYMETKIIKDLGVYFDVYCDSMKIMFLNRFSFVSECSNAYVQRRKIT